MQASASKPTHICLLSFSVENSRVRLVCWGWGRRQGTCMYACHPLTLTEVCMLLRVPSLFPLRTGNGRELLLVHHSRHQLPRSAVFLDRSDLIRTKKSALTASTNCNRLPAFSRDILGLKRVFSSGGQRLTEPDSCTSANIIQAVQTTKHTAW